MLAIEDAAGSAATNKDPLGDLKGAEFKFVLIANGLVDIVSQVIQVVELERICRHWVRRLLAEE